MDESKLRAALSSNPSGVDAVFNTSSTGIMTQLKSALDSLSDGTNGAFATEKNMYDGEVKDLTTQISDMEDQMVQKEASLRKEYADLESLVSNYNAIGKQISSLSSRSS